MDRAGIAELLQHPDRDAAEIAGFRITKGARSMRRFEDKDAGGTRSFCGKCGTPLLYERDRAPKWVNIPRALFETRTGREPR